jgi:hypothetical protein
MNTISNLSSQQLRQAANLKEKIAELEKELSRILGSSPAAPTQNGGPGRRRKMSAATKAKLAAAARARWAKTKGTGSTNSSASKPAKARGTKNKGPMSSAAKAKLSARMKEIWASRRAAQKK